MKVNQALFMGLNCMSLGFVLRVGFKCIALAYMALFQ
jgi:hypothetical protein